MVRTMVATQGWASSRVSRLVMKWVRHRCQLAKPMTAAMVSRSLLRHHQLSPLRPLADSGGQRRPLH